MKDLSLKTLKVYYRCRGKGEINPCFDKEIRELAKKYGVLWYAQGMDIEAGERDLAFGDK